MAGEKYGEVVTFEFPIRDSGRVAPTKTSPHMFYQIFTVWKMKTLMYFYFNSKYFVEDMVIVLMIKS